MKISDNLISTKSSKTQLLNLMNTNRMALTCICGVEHLKDLHKNKYFICLSSSHRFVLLPHNQTNTIPYHRSGLVTEALDRCPDLHSVPLLRRISTSEFAIFNASVFCRSRGFLTAFKGIILKFEASVGTSG